MTLLELQLQQLRERYGAIEVQPLGSGTVLVTVPLIVLPQGWSKTATSVRFLVPASYPYAALDCFWADQDLRLATGAIPCNSSPDNLIPEAGAPGLWFSWHLAQPWNPNRDTLSSWMNTINDRFQKLQ